jgi:heme iron utilization protein
MSLAVDARRLLRARQHGTLGTLSTALAGYPYCSVVPYALDHGARPIILVSRLAEHTHNMAADPRVCLFAHEGVPDVQTGSRVTLMGRACRVDAPDAGTERYARYFPSARTYKDDLDFDYYRIEPVSLRVIAGFAKVHWVSREAYTPPAADFAAEETAMLDALNTRCAGAVRDHCILHTSARHRRRRQPHRGRGLRWIRHRSRRSVLAASVSGRRIVGSGSGVVRRAGDARAVTTSRAAHVLGATSLITLIFVCLAWELWGAPLRPGGSWLVLKTLPLLAPLMGVLRGNRYTFKWSLMLALPYFIEGATRAFAEPAPGAAYAIAEAVLASVFFANALVYLRSTRGAETSA